MKNIKSYFMFSSGHRNGIFFLISVILILQVILLNFDWILSSVQKKDVKVDKEWLAIQGKIDSLKNNKESKVFEIKPFNPNYLSDYKGYMLGMSVEEIDRLHKYREKGNFINSKEDFKKVTKVSDSILNAISPYFKFPDWVVIKNSKTSKNQHQFFEKENSIKKNINTATKEDLIKVYGIGEKLAEIIFKEKEKFGEFASINQLQYVWGITPETFQNIKKSFFVERTDIPLNIVNINTANTKELSKFPYFNYKIAKDIITYRSMNGDFKNIEDLTKIKDFPIDKLEILVLYLEIN